MNDSMLPHASEAWPWGKKDETRCINCGTWYKKENNKNQMHQQGNLVQKKNKKNVFPLEKKIQPDASIMEPGKKQK